MLTGLYIQNYAIIDRLELEPAKGLTTITGETGAGKSIVLGALSLVLGKRADMRVLHQSDKKCIVEATIAIGAYGLTDFFEQHGLDYADSTLLRREITPQGKSRAFINDTPVTLAVLRTLASQLIDLHQQHETLELAQQDFQRQVVDAVGQQETEAQAYRTAYKAYLQQQKKLTALEQADREARQAADYITFQLQELAALDLEDVNEQEILEEKLAQLTHAEQIKQGLFEAQQLLGEQEGSIVDNLGAVKQALRGLLPYNSAIEPLYNRLDSTLAELQDVQREMALMADTVSLDEEEIITLQDRLNAIYRLQKKHGVDTIEGLLQLQTEWAANQQGNDNRSAEILALKQAIAGQQQTLLQQAKQLSKKRQSAGVQLQESVNRMLVDVGLPNAQFTVSITADNTQLHKDGIDSIVFYFTANTGAPPQPIGQVASGGELSRLMLVIKSLVAASTALPTLIFDEIDTGISGAVALKVGELLRQLAAHHQVMVITHLPQIASQGEQHFYVYKESDYETTATRVKPLTGEERVRAIAEMIGGDSPTAAAITNARELLRNV